MKWQTFNIKYCLYESYLFKRFILAYIQITKLLKENYLQKNFIFQNCLHRVNMWCCGYYMATDLSEVLDPALCGGSVSGLVPDISVSFRFLWHILKAMITYLKLKCDIFWVNWRSFWNIYRPTLNIWERGMVTDSDSQWIRQPMILLPVFAFLVS